MIKLKPLLINLIITLGGGGLISILTRNSMNIYEEVAMPPFAPPSWLFPIVWSILYILMAISAYMIYESKSSLKLKALIVYAFQLLLNFIWPLVFFNAHAFLAALLILLLMWIMVLWMITLFHKIKPLAAYLQIPYILWLTFAAVLNLSVYILNA